MSRDVAQRTSVIFYLTSPTGSLKRNWTIQKISQIRFRLFQPFLKIKSPARWLLLTSLECWRGMASFKQTQYSAMSTFVSSKSRFLHLSLNPKKIDFLLSFLCHCDFLYSSHKYFPISGSYQTPGRYCKGQNHFR